MKFLIAAVVIILYSIVLYIAIVSITVSNPDPPSTKKYCTIKLNDANKSTSYLTGECVSNE